MNERQKRFVSEYLIDLNATQAAIRAGYSAKTARAIGQENLTKPYIQQAIQAANAERLKRNHISQDRVLQEIARVALADIRQLYKNGKLLSPHEMSDDIASAVAQIDAITAEADNVPVMVTKVKMHNKISALEMLARHLNMFSEEMKTPRQITIVDGCDFGTDNSG